MYGLNSHVRVLMRFLQCGVRVRLYNTDRESVPVLSAMIPLVSYQFQCITEGSLHMGQLSSWLWEHVTRGRLHCGSPEDREQNRK